MKNPSFKEVYVKGEVSGVKISKPGHMYFNLKDERSLIPCVIYRANRKNIDFEIADGMKLLVICDVKVYRPKGKYQLNIIEVSEDGIGKLFVKYQQLKEKLEKEGLFKEEFKKDLPAFPKRIGIVTSTDGSVIHDIIRTINEKWPYCEVLIYPSAVQGTSAASQLISQIKRADSSKSDVLIIARGGGSIEDLWCFNDEKLVKTVFNAKTPVISGIGHESDFTLCDLVSDKRASTPTMAANFAVNDKEKIKNQINHYNTQLLTFMSSKINDYKKYFKYMASKELFTDSAYVYESKMIEFNNINKRFEYNSNKIITSKRNKLNKIKSEYVIRYPCKMQLDSSRLKLNELETRLIEAMNSIIKSDRHNLDKATDEFRFFSDKFISNQNHRLNQVRNSFVIQNPCKIQLDNYNSNLKLHEENITKLTNYKLESSQKDFENILNRNLFKNSSLIYESKSQKISNLTNQFLNKSNEIILTNSYRLDAIKTKQCITNPKLIYTQKNNELENIKDKNIIKNPYLILDRYNQQLNLYNGKLDKINQFIRLKQEQEKQKATYRKIILVIVAVVIIMLLLIIGGI